MITLELNKPYPLPTATQAGASAQFLLKEGNLLQVVLPDMDTREQTALRRGKIKAGFLYDQGCLLWLFRFYDKHNKQVITLDCPFDASIIPKEKLALHNITQESERLSIEIHGVDEKPNTRALRYVTMSHELTLSFLSAVQDQLTTQHNPYIMQQWMTESVSELIKKANMTTLGAQ